ncbi:MAG: hypothetical protein HFG32_05545 [Eubacterium sp.]|nr:hypothetical protein [Eubacterium sp.]
MLGKIRNIKLPFWANLMIFLIFGSLFVLYSIRLFYIMPIDSDYSNLILEASDIISGNVLLNDWIQTGISFLTTDLLYYIIAVLINGVSRNSYLVASGLMFSCMLFSTLPLIMQGEERKYKCTEWLLYLGLCTFPSIVGINLLRAHTGVYVWIFIAVACFCQLYKGTCKKRHYILFCSSLILGCIGDAVVVPVAVLPFLLYCVRDMLANKRMRLKRDLLLILLTAGSAVTGSVLDKLYYVVGTADKNSFLKTKSFENFDAYISKLNIYLHAVLGMNDADFTSSELLSVDTVFFFIKTVVVLFGFCLIVYHVYHFIRGRKWDIISEILSLGFLFVSIVFVITTISSDILSARYIGTCPCILAVLIIRYMRKKNVFDVRFSMNKIPVWMVANVLGIVLLFRSFIPIRELTLAETEQERVASVLEQYELESGYANFWDSSIITVVSRQKVKVRAVTMGDEVAIFPWGCKRSWYEEKTNFILIRDPEHVETGVTYENALRIFKTPKQEVDFENYKILIYDHDISDKLRNVVRERMIN